MKGLFCYPCSIFKLELYNEVTNSPTPYFYNYLLLKWLWLSKKAIQPYPPKYQYDYKYTDILKVPVKKVTEHNFYGSHWGKDQIVETNYLRSGYKESVLTKYLKKNNSRELETFATLKEKYTYDEGLRIIAVRLNITNN